ncbi:hypothetical protein HDU86_007550 [Geranomyces michiganensis]|nr:hypothetical protein HDU86_007550 [Geranomyces michiganensis]
MCPHAAAFAGLTYMLVLAAEGATAAPHPHSCQLSSDLCCKPYTYECTSDGNWCKQGDADCFPWAYHHEGDFLAPHDPPFAHTPEDSAAATTQVDASPGGGTTAPTGLPEAPPGGGATNTGQMSVVPAAGAQAPLPTPGADGTSPARVPEPLSVGAAGGPLPAGAARGTLPPAGAVGGTLPAAAAAGTDAPVVSGALPPGAVPSSLGSPAVTATVPAAGLTSSSSRGIISASAISMPPPAIGPSPDSHQTSGTNLGLAVGLPIALIAALAFAAWLLWRRGTRAIPVASPVDMAAKSVTRDVAGLGALPVVASGPSAVAHRPFVPFVPPPQAGVPTAAVAAATAPKDVPAITSYGNVDAAKHVQSIAGGEHVASAAEIGGHAAAGLGAVGGVAVGLAAAGAAAKASTLHSPSRSLPRSDNGTLGGSGTTTNLDNSSRSLATGFAGEASSSVADPAHNHHAEGLATAAALGAGAAAIRHRTESDTTLRHSASTASLDADAVVREYSRGNSLSSLASSLGGNNSGLNAGAGAGPSSSTPSSDHAALAALALGAGAGGVAAATAAHRTGSVSSRSSRYLGGAAGGLARRGTLHTRDEVITVVDERTGHVLDKKTVTVTQYEGDMTDLEAHSAQIEIAGSEIARVGETVTVEYADSNVGSSPGEEVPVPGSRATVMTTVVDGAGDVVSIKTTSSIKDPPSPGGSVAGSNHSANTPPPPPPPPSGPDISPLALAGAALAVDEGVRTQASRSTLSDAATITRQRQGSLASGDAATRAYDSDGTVVRNASSNDTLASAGQAHTHHAERMPLSEEQALFDVKDAPLVQGQMHNPYVQATVPHAVAAPPREGDAQDLEAPSPPAQSLTAAVPLVQTPETHKIAGTTFPPEQALNMSTPVAAAAITSGITAGTSTPSASVARPAPTTLTSFPPFPRRSTPSVPEEDDNYPDLSAYHPPAPTSHVCVQAYYPVRPDEMQMQVGDLVGIEREYPDGWARGQNITHGRKRAHFPLGILAPIKSGPSQRVARVGGRSWLGRGGATGGGGGGAGVVEERRRISVIPPRDQSLPLRRRPTDASSRTFLTGDETSGTTSSSSSSSLSSLRGDNKHDADADEDEDEVRVLETRTETSHEADGGTIETTRTLVGTGGNRALRERPSATNLVTKVVKTAHTRNPDGTLTKRVSVTITDTPSV